MLCLLAAGFSVSCRVSAKPAFHSNPCAEVSNPSLEAVMVKRPGLHQTNSARPFSVVVFAANRWSANLISTVAPEIGSCDSSQTTATSLEEHTASPTVCRLAACTQPQKSIHATAAVVFSGIPNRIV